LNFNKNLLIVFFVKIFDLFITLAILSVLTKNLDVKYFATYGYILI